MHQDIITKTLQMFSCYKKTQSLSAGIKIHLVSTFLRAERWEIYSSSALCSYLLSSTVMVTKPCLCESRMCMQRGMISALQRCKPSHTAVFNPVGVWVCLRFPSGTSAESKVASVSHRQKTQLIVAFVCKAKKKNQQRLFLIRSL